MPNCWFPEGYYCCDAEAKGKKPERQLLPVSFSPIPPTDGRPEFDTQLSPEEYPPFFTMLTGPEPGLLSGIERENGISQPKIVYISLEATPLNTYPAVTTQVISTSGDMELLIAKIGYCYAIAEKGHDYFDKTEILDLILQRNPNQNIWDYVGGQDGPDQRSAAFHYLHCFEQDGYLVVTVKLFGSLGGPSYLVVVGKLLNPENEYRRI